MRQLAILPCCIPCLIVAAMLSAEAIARSTTMLQTTTPDHLYQAAKYRELGLMYQSEGRHAEAIATMQKSVKLDPENVEGRVNLGWAQHLAKREAEAAETLLQAIERDSAYVPAYNALGIVYLVKGDLVPAVATHGWATVLKPDGEIAYYNLSLSLERLWCYELAIANAIKATALEPGNPHPWVALALAYWGNNQMELAQEMYRKASWLDSRYGDRTYVVSHLPIAGFSQRQIETVEEILESLEF